MAEIGEIIRIAAFFTHPAGSVAQNVFIYEVQDSVVDDADLLSDYQAWFFTDWIDNWQDLANDQCVCDYLEFDVLNGDGTVKRNIGPHDFDSAGLLTGEPTSAGVAAYLQATSERTKSLGKKYIPSLDETMITDGQLNATAIAKMAVLLLEYMEVVPVGTSTMLVPGVLSRVTETFQEFTGSGYITDIPAYQRRRKPGVGS